jgi:hypothetical protein
MLTPTETAAVLNITEARFLTLRVFVENTLPTVTLFAGLRPNQDAKCLLLGHFV